MLRTLVLLTNILCCMASNANQDLPTFGDSISGIISLEQERRLGQQFLRSIRSQAPTLDDPLLQDFLEHLTYRLASHSQLEDRRLDLVIIRNRSLNAFAAPGGIIGVHDGLFLYAQTKHEISAILSHELAHLSQRHFARRVSEGKKSAAINIAGLLAGVVLAATTGEDAALAAFAGSQGLAQNQALRYSREREAEADRLGISTLDEAGLDPRAMAYMFERMQRASRYNSGNNIPEFLRTHPVTNDRISDSYNQTQNYQKKQFPKDLDYQLMRARTRAITSENQHREIQRFKAEVGKSSDMILKTANKYGLAISLTRSLMFEQAKTHIKSLRHQHPLNIPFRIAEAELYTRSQRPKAAIEILSKALKITPNNYPLSVAYAKTLLSARNPQLALEVLIRLSIERPNDEHVWYLLAEAYGLANNIPGVHEARAEFFVLNGNFDQAIKQLGYALPLVRHNFQHSARVKQKLENIWVLKDGG